MDLYIIIVLLAIVVNLIITYVLLRKKSFKKENCLWIVFIQSICFVIGSKLLDIWVNYKYYFYYNIEEAIRSGYMFYGGMFLGILYIFLYCKIKELNYKAIFEVVIPNFLLFFAICKIGCFLNNCCTGIFDFPIQIVESIICIITYLIIMKKESSQKSIYWTCVSFGLIRAITFLLRSDLNMRNLIVNEVISIGILIFGIGLLIRNREIKKV